MIEQSKSNNGRFDSLLNPVVSILQGLRELFVLVREVKNLLAQQNELLKQNNELLQNLLDKENSSNQVEVNPNFQAGLSDYPTFDWAKIGATVISTDSDGPTVVEYEGLAFKRRRSSIDDVKGAAIWFSCSQKDNKDQLTYLRLITFKEQLKIRSLHGEIKEHLS
uniref:Uncharacterized protein n=2 Tax=Gloeothece TaxID=28070 RepID=E0UMQ6_GLOV7|nr:hypothetical protein Cyan7822_6453 [Gloeothece verrucosa PCC 7822]